MIALSIILFCYRPQMKLWEGYIFTAVCDSVHRGVVSQHSLQVSRPTPWPGGGLCTEADLPGRRLLLWAVLVLLECILVINFILLA